MDLNKYLNIMHNPGCDTGCNKEKREEITENNLCNIVSSVSDGLTVRCVGEWGMQKIFFLLTYFGIFSIGMKNKWGGKINYIEICSGPGRCINRSNGDEFNGTSLAVLEHPAFKHMRSALFFDADKQVIETLQARANKRNLTNVYIFEGNYNNDQDICLKLNEILKENCLNLVFIDPTDCGVPFQLIKSLKSVIRNMDLIINVASWTDFNRNVRNIFQNPDKYSTVKEKYIRFLDNYEFFDNAENQKKAMQGQTQQLRIAFRDLYQRNLEKIGFRFFEFNSVRNFYDLLFATSNKTGIEFWQKATRTDINGQIKLF